MKRVAVKVLLFVMVLFSLASVSCDRQCHCYGFDGDHMFYTEEDLEEIGYVCTDMAIHYGSGLYYSLCEWD